MKLYETLVNGDIISPVAKLIAQGLLDLSPQGKITARMKVDITRPWIDAKFCPKRDCNRWLGMYFTYYKIIPSGCRNCWKLSFRPKTLEDMFTVFKGQKEMKIPSKCGLETRGRTGHVGGYSSFWYCSLTGGLEQARNTYVQVKEKLEVDLGYSDGLALKRGCTEIEHHFLSLTGRGSDDWDRQAEFFDVSEKLLDTVFEPTSLDAHVTSDVLINYTMRKWIEFAFEHNDKTYLKYTEADSFVPPLLNYMASGYLKQNIPITWEGGPYDRVSKIEAVV